MLNSDSSKGSVQPVSQQINEKIGKPRELEILEFTDSSIKFAWMPPPLHSAFKINNFLISYVDRLKVFRDSNGSLVSFVKGISTTVKVPARGDPTIKIMWLVAGLAPHTEYDFNISAQLANEVQGPAVHKLIKTRPSRPAKVDAPHVLDVYTDNTVLVRTGNASERNGPVLKYWLVITPMGVDNSFVFSSRKSSVPDQSLSEQQKPPIYETRDRDITNLLRYSLFNGTLSNESAYIAAEFEAAHWPIRFILGDGNTYGRFLNRRLIRSWNYRAYIVAFTDEAALQTSNRKAAGQLNMVGLSDILNSKPKTGGYLESDLFSWSYYSDVFNTNSIDANQNAIMNTMGISVNDFHNILWVAGNYLVNFILKLINTPFLIKKWRKIKKFQRFFLFFLDKYRKF